MDLQKKWVEISPSIKINIKSIFFSKIKKFWFQPCLPSFFLRKFKKEILSVSGWITLESSLLVVKYQRWEVLKFWHTCPTYFNFLQNKTKYLNSSSWNYKNCFTIYELIILTTFTYFWMLRLVNCSSASKFKLSIDLSFEWRQIFNCYKFIGLFHKKKLFY